MKTIYLYGDSVGKGVVFDEARGRYTISPDRCTQRLATALDADIVNRARMGATCPEGFADFCARQAEPGAVVVIEYGGNDCDMTWAEISERPDLAHQARVPVERFLRSLVDFVREARARRMHPLLVTPPPLVATRYFDWVARGLCRDAILRFLGDVQHIYRWQERYATAVREAASETGCALFDMRSAFLAHRSLESLYCLDGIHPNAQGHARIAEAALTARDSLSGQLARQQGAWSA